MTLFEKILKKAKKDKTPLVIRWFTCESISLVNTGFILDWDKESVLMQPTNEDDLNKEWVWFPVDHILSMYPACPETKEQSRVFLHLQDIISKEKL